MRGMYSQYPLKRLVLYIFNSFMVFYYPTPFPHHPHFCDRINHDDTTPQMVIRDALDCTQKESTTPKGVAFHASRSPG